MQTPLFFLTFILQPFWSAIFYIFNLPRKCPNVGDFTIWALIISIMGIYWFPWGDNQTHFAIYYSDVIQKYYTFSLTTSYFLYDYIIAKIGNLTGNYVWGYFFWIFTSLLLFYRIIWSKFLSNRITNNYVLLFLSIILIIGIRELLDLNRNTTAIFYMLSGIGLWDKNKFFAILLVIISTLIHSSITTVIIAGIFFYALFKIKTRRKYVSIVFITIILAMFSYVILRRFAPERVISTYLDGQWGTGTGVGSGFAYLASMVNNLIFIILGYGIIKNIDVFKRSYMLSVYFMSFLIGVFVWFLWVLRERYVICNIVTAIALIILNWNTIRNSPAYHSFVKCLRFVIVLCIFRFILILCQTYSANFVHNNGAKDPYKALSIVANSFVLPTPLLLDVDDFGFNDKEYVTNYDRVKETIRNEE